MKKIITFIFLVIVLAGCNHSTNLDNEGSGNDNLEDEENVKSNVSISFSEVEVIARDKSLYVSGEAKSNVDAFYYTLEQGDTVIIDETVVDLGDSDGEWRAFEIDNQSFEVEEESDESPYLKFYVKDNDTIINPNYVPIDLVFY